MYTLFQGRIIASDRFEAVISNYLIIVGSGSDGTFVFPTRVPCFPALFFRFQRYREVRYSLPDIARMYYIWIVIWQF